MGPEPVWAHCWGTAGPSYSRALPLPSVRPEFQSVPMVLYLYGPLSLSFPNCNLWRLTPTPELRHGSLLHLGACPAFTLSFPLLNRHPHFVKRGNMPGQIPFQIPSQWRVSCGKAMIWLKSKKCKQRSARMFEQVLALLLRVPVCSPSSCLELQCESGGEATILQLRGWKPYAKNGRAKIKSQGRCCPLDPPAPPQSRMVYRETACHARKRKIPQGSR